MLANEKSKDDAKTKQERMLLEYLNIAKDDIEVCLYII